MLPTPEVFANDPQTRPAIYLAGDRYTLLANGAETGGAYAAFEAMIPPGGGPPLHLHQREDELFCIWEGEITFFTGERKIVATPGTWVHAPRGIAHRFHNGTQQPARMLIVTMPAGIEDYFCRVGTEVTDRNAPIPAITPEEIQRLMTLAPEYGLQIFKPEH